MRRSITCHGLLQSANDIRNTLYILRCAPTYECREGLQSFDNVIRNNLETILNVDLAGPVGDQSSLPVRYGGLGILPSGGACSPSLFGFSSLRLHANILDLQYVRSHWHHRTSDSAVAKGFCTNNSIEVKVKEDNKRPDEKTLIPWR